MCRIASKKRRKQLLAMPLEKRRRILHRNGYLRPARALRLYETTDYSAVLASIHQKPPVRGIPWRWIGGIVAGAMLIMLTTIEYPPLGHQTRDHFVKSQDLRPVPVFPTPTAARLGSGLTPQSKGLMPGQRYRVVKSEGDAIMVEGAIGADGKKIGLWVDRRYVIDAE